MDKKPIIHPDIHIYLKNLSEFLDKNKKYYTQLFGNHDVVVTFNMVKEYAILNWSENGEPNVSKEQFLQIKQRLDGIYSLEKRNIFQFTHTGHPPLCLN